MMHKYSWKGMNLSFIYTNHYNQRNSPSQILPTPETKIELKFKNMWDAIITNKEDYYTQILQYLGK